MLLKLSLIGAGFILLSVAGASADEIDCKNPVSQNDMTQCAQVSQDEADKALNAQYKKTRAAMVAVDKDQDADMQGAEKALLKAQRAWIDYRDGHCEAEGFQAHGGSMEPMLVAGCIARLTDLRTAELKALSDSMGN